MFVEILAAIHTINMLNDSGFLPNMRWGYVVCDTCSDATKALLSVNGSLPVQSDLTDYRPPVKVVIGGRFSEESIPVSKLLGVYLVPQISSTSSASILSDKTRYPSFVRTIPSDVHQTRALAKLMSRFGWDWIAVVSGDDEYSKSALESFLLNAKETNLCVDFQEIIPHYLDNSQSKPRIKEVAKRNRSSTAQVVLVILKGQLVEQLFQEMLRTNTSRIWVASDSWSMDRPLANMEGITKVGDIFGFTFMTGKNPGFEQYLQKLSPAPGTVNRYIEEYKQLSLPDPQQADDDFIVRSVDLTRAYGKRLAVWAIAHALLHELKKVNFTLDNNQFYFDEFGNFVTGYDLVMWKIAGSRREIKVVGQYHLKTEDVMVNEGAIIWGTPNNVVPESRCSQPCPHGTMKNIVNVSCCYDCIRCPMGTYSDASAHECVSCPNNTWSEPGSVQCTPRTEKYFKWHEAFTITLLVAAALGELLLLVIFIIFLWYRETPAVKVAGGNLAYTMIAGLSISFGSSVLFLGRPNNHLCKAQQTMYGMGFTLCITCILVKAFRTYLVFLFDPGRQHRLKRLYKPLAIVVLGTAVQALICILRLIFDSPKVDEKTSDQSMEILIQCVSSNIGFGIMLSYIALLAFICFLLALTGRKAPGRYHETGYIIFSMLIFLFVWVCFIPVYVTVSHERAGVEAAAILVSTYGIIFCHFVPNLYIIIFKRSTNNIQSYLEGMRQAVSHSSPLSSEDITPSTESGDTSAPSYPMNVTASMNCATEYSASAVTLSHAATESPALHPPCPETDLPNL
ncbi:G-protein coupled receptor family C group 6 member A-like [Scleropages formosus]|uniref:G-protein coupled receptor family C group 6 member A-like n=1 Tax=Scleropages formosus TaxID=113540 RepID=A0A0P7VCI5_SCLFO|nr:G-protein coupled receptor family C group 6 member A-like [Scleropages formosus]